jgi:hypothetical protein
MKDVSRRQFLAASLLGISSVGLLGSTDAEAAKATKQQANYRDHPHGGQHCSKCRYFIQPGSCKLVDGAINPNGWCKFFLAPS